MKKIPMLLHAKGFYFVRMTVDGKRHDYNFGKDRNEAESQYNQFVSELCQARNSPNYRCRSVISVSISEMVVRYLEDVSDKYRTSNAFSPFKSVGIILCKMFGEMSISNFTIQHFNVIITEMIKQSLSFRTLNGRICVVKRFFKHAFDCEVITAEKYFQMKSVPLIRMEDNRVKHPRIVPPVDLDVVERTFPYLSPMTKDMIIVQLHSGMRAGELCIMYWKENRYDRSCVDVSTI